MKKKIAFITGVTGQDGSYLAKLLLKKQYVVHGLIRKSSNFNTQRIEDIYQGPFDKNKNFFLHYGDLIDGTSLGRLILKIKPDEIYNLGAQSHVGVSFESPEYTADVNALGTLRILEIIRSANLKVKFYQASTSEIFGNSNTSFQDEKTPFHPVSPYGTSKLFSYWIVKNYRSAYNLFASNGILFNHESPMRGNTFVTKKIIKGLVNFFYNNGDCLWLGNLDSKRDWGHAKDYVEMQWKILQLKKPIDLVIATGKTYTVRNFIERSLKHLNKKIIWYGKGINERGYIYENKKKRTLIRVDKRYFRPNELDYLKGNIKLAKKTLKFKLKYNFDSLIKDMLNYEIKNLK